MTAYRGVPIRAVTESAMHEAAEFGFTLDDVARLLDDSYDCSQSARRKGVEERCVRHDGKIVKIVIELKTSARGFEYWRIRQIGSVR